MDVNKHQVGTLIYERTRWNKGSKRLNEDSNKLFKKLPKPTMTVILTVRFSGPIFCIMSRSDIWDSIKIPLILTVGDDEEQKNSSVSSSSSSGQRLRPKEHEGKRKDSSTSVSIDKQCRPFSLAEIKLATHDFDDALVIGKGGFGNVYKGNVDFGKGTDVAIKRLKLDSDQGATEFRAEIEMLSKFRHSHIVSLLGYHEASDNREMILVYEYMPNGSLEDHLHKRRTKGTNSHLLTWVQRLHICVGAARGLDYLHTGTGVQSRVIHRDIKSSNILLDENLAGKISDFGLSRIGPANQSGTTNVYTDLVRGTFGYMDAEYFATHRLTRKSDVYAFGVVLLEVLCGRPALDFTLDEEQHSLAVWAKDYIREGNIDRIIDPCLRGQTKAKFLKEFGRIAYDCLLDRSKERPTMSKVVARLEVVLAWALKSDQKYTSKFMEKSWSLFLIKAPSKFKLLCTLVEHNLSSNKDLFYVPHVINKLKEDAYITHVSVGRVVHQKPFIIRNTSGKQLMRPTKFKIVQKTPLKYPLFKKQQRTKDFNIKQSRRRSSTRKKLGPSITNKGKDMMLENHATTIVEGGYESGSVATTSGQVVLPTRQTNIPILKEFTFSELQKATRNFRPDRCLGERGFWVVYKGWLDSLTFVPRKASDGLAVAVKRLTPANHQGVREWQAEVDILGTFSHPNVVKLLGYCRENLEFLLVYEYVQKGSLELHLFGKGGEPLPWERRIKMALGVAYGLAFLHTTENNIIYRDVKSSNIEFDAKLMGFGLAKLGPVNGESHITTRIMGTYYSAPEYIATGCDITTGHLYVKSDVYGFGVVMLEMITGLRVLDTKRPWPKQVLVDWAKPSLTGIKKLRNIMDPRLEQVYPSKAALKVGILIRNCLRQKPLRRPSMEEVRKQSPEQMEKAADRQNLFLHYKLQSKPPKSMDFFTTLVLLFTVLGIVFHYLQKHHDQEDDVEQKDSSLPSSSSDQQRSLLKEQEEDNWQRKDSSPSSSLSCRHFSLSKIKLATNDFNDAFIIGKGGFGNVYKGKVDLGGGTDVAIKRLKLDSSQGAIEFQAEIEMLSKFRHSHIVSLLGYHEASDKREMILVYEYMPNGSLEDHLHKKKVNGKNSSVLTWVQRLQICIGAARGLDYLHTGTSIQSRVLHRDIKSSNILLDENFSAKISDFGLSRIGPANLVGTTNVYTSVLKGTFGYMDAEYFATHRLTRKSDVYAFGVVLLEVLCGRPALDFALDWQEQSLSVWAKQCIQDGNVDRIIDPCLKGQTKGKCLKEFGRIAYECLLASSKDRPTMSKVVVRLELVLAWTLKSDQKHVGRSSFIEKAWSSLLIKSPSRISSPTKKIWQSINNKRKGITMEKHPTKIVEGDVATTSLQTKIPNLKMFTFSELESATRNFRRDMCLGEGAFGKVYKGWLDHVTLVPRKAGDGLAVAIKRLSPKSTQGLIEWQAEVNLLGTFNHPNLVKLFGYCRKESMELLLVYEYMQKGSLDNHLFMKHGEPLPWETRMKIAMGAAHGLAYLHATENNVMFRDLKSSNILLDDEFNAKLSDFGLAKLGPDNGSTHVTTRVVGTHGYAAPEYIITGHLYVKSDVYGFGVVMLEMLTGLRVLDRNRPSQERNLVQWARPSLTVLRKLRKIIDPRLEQVYPSKGAMKAAKLIQNCLDNDPKRRPSMEEVVACLEEINSIKIQSGKLKG
ncbi:hypothetical protein LXL04_022237 [Taraxacum kok-saghyz]